MNFGTIYFQNSILVIDNSVDPDQLIHQKPADQDSLVYIHIMKLNHQIDKQVAQWAMIAHLGASIMFGDTIIHDA